MSQHFGGNKWPSKPGDRLQPSVIFGKGKTETETKQRDGDPQKSRRPNIARFAAEADDAQNRRDVSSAPDKRSRYGGYFCSQSHNSKAAYVAPHKTPSSPRTRAALLTQSHYFPCLALTATFCPSFYESRGPFSALFFELVTAAAQKYKPEPANKPKAKSTVVD